jgi:flagellar basal-body rod modification protein FlgD
MSQINATNSLIPTQKVRDVQNMDDLNSNDFLQLMITQLQQQDPLNPMDNNQLVQQISSIRELSATTKLTSTLDSVLTGQNIATASGLIGKTVDALDDTGNEVSGKVDRVSVTVDPSDDSKRDVRVHIGDQEIQLKNVRDIISA